MFAILNDFFFKGNQEEWLRDSDNDLKQVSLITTVNSRSKLFITQRIT